MISPTYPRTGENGDCFKFWYHMYGSTPGTLNIWLRIDDKLDTNVWSRSYNLENRWVYGHVTVKSRRAFQIALEGKNLKRVDLSVFVLLSLSLNNSKLNKV